MNDELFGAVMRIKLNGPKEKDDAQGYKKWIVESVIDWNDMKQRNHNIVLLKRLSEMRQTHANMNVLQLLQSVKSSV